MAYIVITRETNGDYAVGDGHTKDLAGVLEYVRNTIKETCEVFMYDGKLAVDTDPETGWDSIADIKIPIGWYDHRQAIKIVEIYARML